MTDKKDVLNANNIRKVQIELNKECWKELKIMSIKKELSLQDTIKEILEKYTAKIKDRDTNKYVDSKA